MKSIINFVGATAAVFVGTCGVAFAGFQPIPEPGSLALVGVAVVALVAVAARKKK